MRVFIKLMILLLFASYSVNAQIQVTNLTGTTAYGGLSVTVTSAGSVSSSTSCLSTTLNNYWIGVGGTSSGSYIYTCSRPVYKVHVRAYAINAGEYMQVYLNGSAYSLTTADMISYTGCGAGGGACFLSSGLLYGPASGGYNSASFEIKSCTPINNFELFTNGSAYGITYLLRVDTFGCVGAASNYPCENDTLKLYGLGDTTSATYAWSGPGGFTSTLQNPFRFPATYSDTGWYVLVKTSGTTVNSDSVYVSVKWKPSITASSSSPICTGGNLFMYSGPGFSGQTYSWSGPHSFTSTQQNPARTGIIMADSGYYRVIVDTAGCKDTALIRVIVDSLGKPTASNTSPACSNIPVSFTSTGFASGTPTYLWSGPTGSVSVLQNFTLPSPAPSYAGSYTLTVTSGACSDTAMTDVVLNVSPPVPSIGVTPPICSGQTLNLTATDTAGATYNWVGPNGFTSALQNPTIVGITTAATGTYTLTCTLGPCTSLPTTVYVLVDSTPAVPTASATTPICSGDSLTLSSTCITPGVRYNWSGPASYSSTYQNPVLHSVITSQSGNYTVTVTKGACTNSASVAVVINQTPTAPVVSSTSPMCSGGLLTLSAYATPSTGTYHWSGPLGFSSLVQNPTIASVPTTASGVYSVYEVVNGCTSPTSVHTVVINPTPPIPVAWSNTPVCENDTLELYATDASTTVTYGWTGPSSFTSTDQNPTITNVSPSATGVYTVTVTEGPCSSINITNVTITAAPPLVATNNGPVCTGDTLKLTATSGAGNTFVWVGPYTFTAPGSIATRYPAISEYAGVYTVTVTEAGGCTSTTTDTVKINVTPAPPWVPWLTFCQYAYAPPLMAVEAPNVMWYTTAAGAGGNTIPPTPNTSVPGIYFFYLNQTMYGCPSEIDSIQVIVNPKPVTTLNASIAAVCPHDTLRYTATNPDPFVTYHWYPSLYLDDSLSASVLASPITDMHYDVVATNEFGCADTQSTNVSVYAGGVLLLNTPDSITLYPGESYHIQPMTNCTSFMWFPPSGLSSTRESDPTATPEISTRYYVEGVTEHGCKVMDSINFHIGEETLYGIPNAFTPGNGVNNTFKIMKAGIAQLNYFRVFNRWGTLIFETTNINDGWDGTYKGEPQPVGVYVYEVQAVSGLTNKVRNMKGNVTLLR